MTVLAALLAAVGSATVLEPPMLEVKPPPEAVVLDRYGRLLDDGLHRRLRGRSLANRAAKDRNEAGLLTAAAGEAALDWSTWVLGRMPGPGSTFSMLATGPSLAVSPDRDRKRVQAGHATQRSEGGARRALLDDDGGPAGRETVVDLGMTPRFPASDDKQQQLDATLHLSARALGLDEWRLATRARRRAWSAWVRQELVRGLSVVAAADSAPRRARISGYTGGALIRLPGEDWRFYAHYTRALPLEAQSSEHTVGVRISAMPKRRRRARFP